MLPVPCAHDDASWREEGEDVDVHEVGGPGGRLVLTDGGDDGDVFGGVGPGRRGKGEGGRGEDRGNGEMDRRARRSAKCWAGQQHPLTVAYPHTGSPMPSSNQHRLQLWKSPQSLHSTRCKSVLQITIMKNKTAGIHDGIRTALHTPKQARMRSRIQHVN